MRGHAQDSIENRIAISSPEQPELLLELSALRERLAALEANVQGKVHKRRPEWPAISRRTAKILALLASGAVLGGISLVYAQSAIQALFIGPDGNVGIGSSSPTQKLDVAGTVRSSSGGFQFPDSTIQLTAVALPNGAVVAFNLAACPEKWTEYAPAYGRFVRGIDKSGAGVDPDGQRAVESVQGDAIRNITGAISGVEGGANAAYPWGFHPGENGAFSVTGTQGIYNSYGGEYGPPNGVGLTAIFDAKRVVPTADENRPRNVALLYCQKT